MSKSKSIVGWSLLKIKIKINSWMGHFWTSKPISKSKLLKKIKSFQNQCQNQSLVINARTTSHIFWFDGRRHDWLGPLGLTFIHYFIMLNIHILWVRKMGVLFMGVFFPGVLQRYFFWGCFSRGISSKVFILGIFFPLTGSMCSGPSSSKHDQ